jgi:putative peptidoglycan lipid II flippase
MSKEGLIRSTGVIGIATALSRILGFIRDILFANFLGTSPVAQAFVVAFKIPNTLRDLVGEGAANSAVVPVLSEARAIKGEKEFVHI